jgi:hypothetical protein
MPLTNFDLAAPPTGPQPEITSATFHASIADPVFWQKIHALCVTEFEHGDEADLAWEHFLRAMKGKLSAGEAAKIRDVVGVRGEFCDWTSVFSADLQVWVVELKLGPTIERNAPAYNSLVT